MNDAAFVLYSSAAQEYRHTVEQLTKEVEALEYGANTDALRANIVAQMMNKIEALAPHLPKARHERLEEIHLSLLDFDHEATSGGGKGLEKDTLAAFMQKFQQAVI